jgi:hypothetical protein
MPCILGRPELALRERLSALCSAATSHPRIGCCILDLEPWLSRHDSDYQSESSATCALFSLFLGGAQLREQPLSLGSDPWIGVAERGLDVGDQGGVAGEPGQ